MKEIHKEIKRLFKLPEEPPKPKKVYFHNWAGAYSGLHVWKPGNDMDKLYSLLAVLGLIILPSCASVGAVIEGGKDFTTGVIDGSVKAASGVTVAVLEDVSDITSTAAKAASGVVDTVSTEIDKQTDELQDDTPEKKD